MYELLELSLCVLPEMMGGQQGVKWMTRQKRPLISVSGYVYTTYKPLGAIYITALIV